MLAQVINTQNSHSLTQHFFFFLTEDSCSAHPGQSPRFLHCICQSKFLMAQPCQHTAVQSLQQKKKYNSQFKSFHLDSVNMNFSKLWETVEEHWQIDTEAWHATVHGSQTVKHNLATDNMDATHVTSIHIFLA